MGQGGADYLDDSDDVCVEGPARSLSMGAVMELSSVTPARMLSA
jgi:hypothetical protein